MKIFGTLKKIPGGKTAPGGHELQVDYYEIIGKAPGGEDSFTNQINSEASPDLLLDQRHLVIRGETASNVLKMRAFVMKGFRDFFDAKKCTEVTPPLMVQVIIKNSLINQ